MRLARRLACVVVLGALLSCRPVPDTGMGQPLSVTNVIDRIDELDRRSVRVAGYLAECMGYECRLFLNERDSASWHQYIERISSSSKLPAGEAPPLLGIGGQNDFDRRAAPFANSYVVISGTVTNKCRYHGEPDCTDRSTDLVPLGIQAWRPPAAGPKETGQ